MATSNPNNRLSNDSLQRMMDKLDQLLEETGFKCYGAQIVINTQNLNRAISIRIQKDIPMEDNEMTQRNANQDK